MATLEESKTEEELESSVTVIEKQTQKRIFKIIVIGDSNVGKTCLTYRFCSGKFPDKTEATIGVDFRERTVNVDNEEIKVSFIKTWSKGPLLNFTKTDHFMDNLNVQF